MSIGASMRIVPTPGLSTKIAAGIDIVASLAVEQLGITMKIPFYHPVILGVVGGMTFALFAWKDEITGAVLKVAGPLQNKNTYSYRRNELNEFKNRLSDIQRELTKKKVSKNREIYLFAEHGRPN